MTAQEIEADIDRAYRQGIADGLSKASDVIMNTAKNKWSTCRDDAMAKELRGFSQDLQLLSDKERPEARQT